MKQNAEKQIRWFAVAAVVLLAFQGVAHADTFGNILFIGDSITEGNATRTAGDGNYSWRYQFWKSLVANGDSYQFVGSRTANENGSTTYPTYDSQTFPNRHEAKWGTTSLERMNWLSSHWGDLNRDGSNYAADTAFLFVGGNALPASGLSASTRDQIIGELGTMVDSMQAANANVNVYVLGIIPRFLTDTNADGFKDTPDARNPDYATINTAMEGFQTSKTTANSTVTYVDLYNNIEPTMLYDGTHPNAAGELYIGNTVYEAASTQPAVVESGDSGGGGSSGPVVVNLDINSTGSTQYSGQGAYADTGNDHWNQLSISDSGTQSMSNLTASDGTTETTIDVTSIGQGGHARDGYINGLLSDGHVHVTAIEIDGLDDSKTYDLVFYSTFDNFATEFTIDGVTKSCEGSPTSATYQENFVDGETYVLFEGVSTDGLGGIDVIVGNSYTHATTGTNFTFFSGMQIVEVPEPATMSLLALGGIAMLRRRK